jgi:hypothetical protein
LSFRSDDLDSVSELYTEDNFRQLVDQTVAAAQGICRKGGFKSSITLDAIHECMKDP